MDRYKRINEHKMINKRDLVTIIHDRLKELDLYDKDNNVIFSNDKELYFMYDTKRKNIYITNNYKPIQLKAVIKDSLVKIVKKTNNSSFLIDAFNLELLNPTYHEVRHKDQNINLTKCNEDYNFLLKQSLPYKNYSIKFYNSNHPRFLSEHDANLNAMMLILDDIECGKLNVCVDAIYFYNTNIAYYLLRSCGYDLKKGKLVCKSIFKSPLHMLYLYNKFLYNREEIDIEELNKINCSICRIRKNNKTEYDKIISGDNLSSDTINELLLIATGKIKTKNIFKYFEEKELDKNNSDYIKKLLSR